MQRCFPGLDIPFRQTKPTLSLFLKIAHNAFLKTRVAIAKRKVTIFWKISPTEPNLPQPNSDQKKQNRSTYGINEPSSLCLENSSRNSPFISFHSTLTFISAHFSHFQIKVPVVSRLWSRFSYSDCKSPSPRYDNEFSGNSKTFWSLLLSQRQKLLHNNFAQIPTAHMRQRNFEKRNDVLATARAEDMDTIGFELADLVDNAVFWKNAHWEVYDFFSPAIDTPFSPTASDTLEKGGSVEKPLLLNDEKEISPPTTPLSGRPLGPLALLRIRTFWTKNENVPDCVDRKWFQKLFLCIYFDLNHEYCVLLYQTRNWRWMLSLDQG